jgi:uncharacterized membrane protein
MESRARLLGHPVHQQIVAFPLGLLATALLFDLVYLVGGNGTMAFVSYCLISVGLLTGLVAAPFGTIDWMAIPGGTRAKRVGLLHGVGNLVVMGLFLGSWLLRHGAPDSPESGAFVLSFAAGALTLVTAWLGGELVSRLGVGVSDRAGLDAGSSLHDSGPGRDHVPQRGR